MSLVLVIGLTATATQNSPFSFLVMTGKLLPVLIVPIHRRMARLSWPGDGDDKLLWMGPGWDSIVGMEWGCWWNLLPCHSLYLVNTWVDTLVDTKVRFHDVSWTPDTVTHPSTNRGRRRTTTVIEINQTAKPPASRRERRSFVFIGLWTDLLINTVATWFWLFV